jgi:alcohol dehydrogenase class IV
LRGGQWPAAVPDQTTSENAVVTLHQPRTLVFGAGCAARCADDLVARGVRRVFVVASPSTQRLGEPIYAALRERGGGGDVITWSEVRREPTIEIFRQALAAARDARADAVIGLGGGSPLDVAKLVAALLTSPQDVTEAFGIGNLAGTRTTYLACLPTTAGTGSEVSPNAVLLDESAKLKKAAISPQLVPDAAYVDPMLTLNVPPAVTAATGMDALTHCIEAYANKFAQPLIDPIALAGIGLIARNLARAVENGDDVAARTAVAQGSLYGGLCLGPVNTAAVHALSYPLGSEFHVAHGISNAVLLPHVMDFNLPAAPQRYAAIAVAMGAARADDDYGTALRGIWLVRELAKQCGIVLHIGKLGVPPDAIEHMARAAMNVQRLLVRNVREVTLHDAIEIYRRAF